MNASGAIAQAESFRTFAKESFTFLEWLAIAAAIQWAGIKTGMLSLAVLSFLLQLVAVIYVLLTGAVHFRPYVQSVKWKAARWALALCLVSFLLVAGNLLVTTTVNAIVRTQLH